MFKFSRPETAFNPKPTVENTGEKYLIYTIVFTLGSMVYLWNWVKKVARIRNTGLKILAK